SGWYPWPPWPQQRFIWDDRRRAREGRAEKPESHNFAGLLRARRERPRCSRADERDELASPHSITSSATTRRSRAISRLSNLAVLRLMTNSYLVGCSMGRSAGLAPFKILPT